MSVARRIYIEQIHYPVSYLYELLLLIGSQHHTGSLTIHFSQGTPAGEVEWHEKSRHQISLDSGIVTSVDSTP